MTIYYYLYTHMDLGKSLNSNSQLKVCFVLFLQKLRMDSYLGQSLTKKKREELEKFNNNLFLDTLALLQITEDNLIGAQNHIEGLAESEIIPFSKEFWERVSFILQN